MDFKTLNEALNKLLEGDVVSFVDFKRKKQNDQFEKEHGDEIQKSLDKFLLIEIKDVEIVWAEGRIDGKNSFKDGEKFSYEEFQKRALEYNYINEQADHIDKVKVTLYLDVTEHGQNNKDQYNLMLYLGENDKECDLIYLLERSLKEYAQFNNLEVVIKNDPVSFDTNNLQYAELEKPEEKKEEPIDTSFVKDYSDNGQRLGEDVKVGDILTCSWGYSMTLVDFYKVTERKAKSIKLEKLQNKIISGGGYSGQCIPSQELDRDQADVKNKLFRIGAKWDKHVVCRIKDHSVYYWDGRPESYDHMD